MTINCIVNVEMCCVEFLSRRLSISCIVDVEKFQELIAFFFMMDNVWINYIVDVEISCVESLFRRWSVSCSCYMYNDQWLMNNSGPPHIFLLVEIYCSNCMIGQFNF
jgi:hypothetical protein